MSGHKNAGFIPRVLGKRAYGAQLADLLREHGVLVIENALDNDTKQRIESELDAWFAKALPGEGQFFGQNTKRFSALFRRSAGVCALATHAPILEAFTKILSGDGAGACIEFNLSQAISIGPGAAPQFLHRDEDLWPHRFPFEIMANLMWTIDEFTAENGALRVIPGSHKWPRDRQPQPGETVSATAPPGSAILWVGGLLHAGSANASDRPRRGAVISYRRAWLAPAEKLLLSVPPEVARDLPEQIQRLIGYQLHRPNLGWVEGRDPLEWLNGEFGEVASAADNLTAEQEAMLADIEAHPEHYAGYLT